jgi:hypothetical protein
MIIEKKEKYMSLCYKDPRIECNDAGVACACCAVTIAQEKANKMFDFQKFLESGRKSAFDKQDDMASVEYINYQVGMGVALDEVLKNLGYAKKLNPPNCGSHVRVPETRKETNLSDILTELVKIKEILTVGNKRRRA